MGKLVTTDFIGVKLDITNAFNSVRRDAILETCFRRAQEIIHLVSLAYGSESSLVYGNEIIRLQTGVQQGDPLGPLLFAITIDAAARLAVSPFNLWYLDDATLGGCAEHVIRDVEHIVPALAALGQRNENRGH